MNNQHEFSNGMNGFQISPLLQELMVYFGQLECYEKCPEIIEKTIGISVGHSQVHRVADTYGKKLEETIAKKTMARTKFIAGPARSTAIR